MNVKEERKQTFPLMIDWGCHVPRMFAKQVNARLCNKEQMLEVPSWISNATNQQGNVKEDSLKTSILEFLKDAGGTKESIGSGLILGITMVQLFKIMTALSAIENDPFMQDVMRAVLSKISASDGGGCADLCLANLALLIIKNKLLTGEPVGPLIVAEGNVHLFRECTISTGI